MNFKKHNCTSIIQINALTDMLCEDFVQLITDECIQLVYD